MNEMASQQPYFNRELGKRYQQLLDALGIQLEEYGDKFIGCCGVHSGDNPTSFNLNSHESEFPLSWICWSRGCQDIFGKNLYGLVHGVLSHNLCGWCGEGDEELEHRETYKWIYSFLDGTAPTIEVKSRPITPKEDGGEILFRRLEYLSFVSIPSRYYLSRGYSERILRDKLIGDHLNYGRFYSKAVIPILDKQKNILGVTCRSILPECPLCKCHHRGGCPSDEDKKYPSYKRWTHHNFKKRYHLYNFYDALPLIKGAKTSILCESPNSVLRLEDAGIKGSLASFGCKISRQQLEKLGDAGVRRIILLMDEDKAGLESVRALTQKYRDDFEFCVPYLNLPAGKDIADYPAKLVRANLLPILDKYNYQLI